MHPWPRPTVPGGRAFPDTPPREIRHTHALCILATGRGVWNRSLALVNATGEDCNQIFTGPSYASLKASGKAIGLADWVESGLRGPQ